MAHPDGFHKDEEAKARCWGCSHPEILDPTEADMARARQLIADGYKQTSSKYRRVSRLSAPPFDQMIAISPEAPPWAYKALREQYEHIVKYGHREYGEHLELTPSEFRAFKLLGGGW